MIDLEVKPTTTPEPPKKPKVILTVDSLKSLNEIKQFKKDTFKRMHARLGKNDRKWVFTNPQVDGLIKKAILGQKEDY